MEFLLRGLRAGVRRAFKVRDRRELFGKACFAWLAAMQNRERSVFIRSYRPDFDYDHGGFENFAEFRDYWTRGNSTNNLGDMARLYLLVMNARQVVRENVPGDFAELGVYKGNSAKVLAEIARRGGRRIFLFDTFEGFDPADVQSFAPEIRSAFNDTSLEMVKAFVGEDAATYVPGKFPESLSTAELPEQFALVHLDCDLYEPMKAGLQYFYPRTAPGAMFILHDYGSGHWPGIARAVDEFLTDKPERLVLMPDKSGTAMFRKW